MRWSEIDPALIKRYDQPGPRYTSYPTAPQFRSDFGPRDYLTLIEAGQGAGAGAPLSIYVHVPYCHSQCLYCGCNSVPRVDRAEIARYVAALRLEMTRTLRHVDRARPVVQVHFGGGTPGTLLIEEVAALFETLTSYVALAPDAEIGVELDPRTASPAFVTALGALGFNRLSVGVQDLDPEVQRAIGRVQSLEVTRAVVDAARASGVRGVNVDLIYGLPLQTRARFSRTIDGALSLAPDRVALFNFAYVPHMKPYQARMPIDRLPDVDEKLAIFLEAADRFEDQGYRFIGLDHFARPEDELARALDAGRLRRNFQGYTARSGMEVLAFGASGISQLTYGFAQGERDIEAYMAALDAGQLPVVRGLRLTDDDRLRQAVIEAIMCNQRVDLVAAAAPFGVDAEAAFAGHREALAPMVADDLVRLTPRGLEVTRPGRLVLRNVAMAFDAYWNPEEAHGQRYSRTL
jgi:oxygen-independent coproporphyrinogen III oxidase